MPYFKYNGLFLRHLLLLQALLEQSKEVLRISPLGLDRNHNRYWMFPSEPGLFVEHGWFDAHLPSGGGVGETSGESSESSDDDDFFDARKKPKDRERWFARSPPQPLPCPAPPRPLPCPAPYKFPPITPASL